jgi:hypothetical protein
MRALLLLCLLAGTFLATTNPPRQRYVPNTLLLSGSFDNFQQVWQQNTNDKLHRVAVPQKHRHYHLKFAADSARPQIVRLTIYEGRNNSRLIASKTLAISQKGANLFLTIDGQKPARLTLRPDGFETEGGQVRMRGDTIWIAHPTLLEANAQPYRFLRCRFFTGWLQYPLPNKPDSTYFQNNLTMHDQGGLVTLNVPGTRYTAELTQLVYGQKIKLMKLAIYELPLDSIGINSHSASYTWTSPEAKRLGINLRRIVSGWTLVEQGYQNRNTLK